MHVLVHLFPRFKFKKIERFCTSAHTTYCYLILNRDLENVKPDKIQQYLQNLAGGQVTFLSGRNSLLEKTNDQIFFKKQE